MMKLKSDSHLACELSIGVLIRSKILDLEALGGRLTRDEVNIKNCFLKLKLTCYIVIYEIDYMNNYLFNSHILERDFIFLEINIKQRVYNYISTAICKLCPIYHESL